MADNSHVEALLIEFALGTLPDDDRLMVQEALDASSALSAKLLEVKAAVLEASTRPLTAVPFNNALAWLQGADRFRHQLPLVAQFLGVSEGQAWAVLENFEDDSAWDDVLDGVEVHPTSRAELTLVRIEPGMAMPFSALSPQRLLVLEGGYRVENGEESWRGAVETVTSECQFFEALVGPPCLLLALTEAKR